MLLAGRSDSCVLTFAALCVSANLWITATYAKNLKKKCKIRYLKKRPPVTTSPLMQAASGCVPLHFSRSVWVFEDVFSLASPWHALQLNYNEVQRKWRSQANVRFLECAFLCKIKEQGLLHSWRMKRRLRHRFTVVSKGQNESWLLKKKNASHHRLGRGKKLKMWIHCIISPLFACK